MIPSALTTGVSVCAAISLSLGIGGSEGPSAAQAVEVGGADFVGDDEADRFVGSGAVFLPSSVSACRRQQAAWCHGCRYRLPKHKGPTPHNSPPGQRSKTCGAWA